jgi:hypothetical protein
MRTPFFVIGLARSGTNLVARMLDRHPKASVALDPFMPVFRSLRDAIVRESADKRLQRRYTPRLPFQDYYFDSLAPALLDSVLAANLDMNVGASELEFLRNACAERAALESPSLAMHMEKLSGQTYAGLFDSMIALLADQNPEAQWVGCKEVWIEDFVPVLARALPNSRFIAIERDPRAIIASLLALSQASPSQFAHIPSYARHWRKGIALNRRYQRDADITGRFHLVNYESVVADAEGNAHALCNFLGLDFWPGMTNLSEDGWTGNSGYAHAGRDVYVDSLERWRVSLGPDIVAAVDYLCAPEMRLTDYVPISSPCLDTVVARYLLATRGETYSWRSDSGDELADLAGEALRYALLDADSIDSATLLRRSFLFPETYHAIRNVYINGAS